MPRHCAAAQQERLNVFAFDLLHKDGKALRSLPLPERRRRLERMLIRSDVPALRLVGAFEQSKAVDDKRSLVQHRALLLALHGSRQTVKVRAATGARQAQLGIVCRVRCRA
jgi:ATP-dependent DNA ligase